MPVLLYRSPTSLGQMCSWASSTTPVKLPLPSVPAAWLVPLSLRFSLDAPQSCWWLFRNVSAWCSKTTAKALHIFLSHLMRCSSSAFCGCFQENSARSVRWLHIVSTSVPKNKAKEIGTTFLLHPGNAEQRQKELNKERWRSAVCMYWCAVI